MESSISSSISPKIIIAGNAERLLLRMLLVSLVMFIGCLSACVGSITVFIFRVRGSDNTGDLEACRRAKRKKHIQRAAGARKNDPANIAKQACDIAFERMGFAATSEQGAPVAFGAPPSRDPSQNIERTDTKRTLSVAPIDSLRDPCPPVPKYE